VRRAAPFLLGMALVLALPPSAGAFTYYRCETSKGDKNIRWSGEYLLMYASEVGFPDGSVWQAGLGGAIETYDENPSRFRLDPWWGVESVGTANDRNEVWASGNADYFDDGSVAKAKMRFRCGTSLGKVKAGLVEGDVLFDASLDWTPGRAKSAWRHYGDDNYPLRPTAVHELGHVLGLLHTATTYNAMGDGLDHVNVNGGTAREYLGEDASNGAAYLYGEHPDGIEDLSVSHWRFDRADDGGEYSIHRRTVLKRANGGDLPKETANGEPRFVVAKGQVVRAEFTYENNGQSEQSVDAAYYISGNATISTGDLRIGTGHFTLARNGVYTTEVQLTVPVIVPQGDFYLGVIIDPGDDVDEVAEDNNATYLRIRVLPGPEI
jgi:hypothetical protein